MASPTVFRKYSTYKIFAISLVLFFSGKNPLHSCGYYYIWPDMADTLSTIEPGIVRETIFNQEYLYFSEPYGMQDPYFADENGTSNVDWMTEAWEKSGSIDSANIDEWIQ